MFGHDAQLVLYRLELAQRFAELDAIITVLQCHFEHTGHGPAEQSGVQSRRKRGQQRASAGYLRRGTFIGPTQAGRKAPVHAGRLAPGRCCWQQQQSIAISGQYEIGYKAVRRQ